ncbi:MAG TPA: protoporphyrinogen oxidase, partial [Pirellulaceae bacterium]|nr:protoporphyrinogen oxidase [Pirellulaceae bacterium]
ATLPQFVEMERRHGSLIRGMRVREVGGQTSEVRESGPNHVPASLARRFSEDNQYGAGARYGQFVAPRDGMQRLVEALARRLPPTTIRLNAPVEQVQFVGSPKFDGGWRLRVVGDSTEQYFDRLIVAAPAAVSSRLLNGVDPTLADLVGRIPYAGCAVALLGIRRDQLVRRIDGFGFVVPAIEKRRIIAGSLASLKFPGRAPEGKLLLRIFIGGALQPQLVDLSDDEIRRLVLAELSELVGLTGEPEFFDVARWRGMMPQYHVGHLDLVRQIEERAVAIPNLALAGNAYRGVGVPFCIRSGELAAERLVASAERGAGSAERGQTT